jgi:hypothetical protein
LFINWQVENVLFLVKNQGGHFAPAKVVNLNWNRVVSLSGVSTQARHGLIKFNLRENQPLASDIKKLVTEEKPP